MLIFVIAGLALGVLAGLATDRLRGGNKLLAVLFAIALGAVFIYGTKIAGEGSDNDLFWGILTLTAGYSATGVGLMAIRDRSSHA